MPGVAGKRDPIRSESVPLRGADNGHHERLSGEDQAGLGRAQAAPLDEVERQQEQ